VIAVEPMVNAGRPEVRCAASGWAETADGSPSAHFEAHRGGYGERPVDSDAAERDDRAGVGERSLK